MQTCKEQLKWSDTASIAATLQRLSLQDERQASRSVRSLGANDVEARTASSPAHDGCPSCGEGQT